MMLLMSTLPFISISYASSASGPSFTFPWTNASGPPFTLPWTNASGPSFTFPWANAPICSNPVIPPEAAEWSGWGGNVYNNRWASQNTILNSANVAQLKPYCDIADSVGVSATPTISGDIAYYPTWSGLLVALNYRTCDVIWRLNVTALVLNYAPLTPEQSLTNPVSRTSPQLDNGILYIGTLAHALLVAVDARTGSVLDMLNINPHPQAIITMSPTVYRGRVFVGTSSEEETAAALVPGYTCCSFVGNMVGVDFDRNTERLDLAWNTSMITDADFCQGWTGAALWGSQPSIDEMRSQVFVATGNTYTVPPAIAQCQNETANLTTLLSDPCLPSSVWQESVIAFDLTTGLANWVQQLTPLDIWRLTCGLPGVYQYNETQCPGVFGEDADFGMAPTFIAGGPNTPSGKDTVVVGQKNGRLYALSAQAGQVFWSTQTSPDGSTGGLIWGLAVDDERVYFTAANSLRTAFTLQPSGGTINYSAFGCAALSNGSLLWEIPAPHDSESFAMPTVVGDVVLTATTMSYNVTGSAKAHGDFLALDKYTGRILYDVAMDNTVHAGIAVQDDYVLFGTGYYYGPTHGSFHVLKL